MAQEINARRSLRGLGQGPGRSGRYVRPRYGRGMRGLGDQVYTQDSYGSIVGSADTYSATNDQPAGGWSTNEETNVDPLSNTGAASWQSAGGSSAPTDLSWIAPVAGSVSSLTSSILGTIFGGKSQPAAGGQQQQTQQQNQQQAATQTIIGGVSANTIVWIVGGLLLIGAVGAVVMASKD